MSISISAATFSVVSVLLTSVSAVRTISGIADVVSSAVVIARHLFTFCASLLRVDRFYALKSDVGTNFEGKKKTKEKKIAKHIMTPTEGRYAHYAVDMHVYYKNHLLILLPTIEHFGAPHSYPFVYDPSWRFQTLFLALSSKAALAMTSATKCRSISPDVMASS